MATWPLASRRPAFPVGGEDPAPWRHQGDFPGLYALFTSGVALWSLYGLLVNDCPVLAANLITLIPAAVVLQRKIVERR
ncbi:SemiSWEET family sugar transporter [Parasynechococcus sp.]|uniref:SemiSWEET family sugar transporter n=1 Tax=Parasynechococcus sp. TaxID=3101203 RepID=UPI003704AB92